MVGDPEFDLFIKEAAGEITAKAGQKCTAVRRILVPEALRQPVAEALRAALDDVAIGDPRLKEVGMGALASGGQKQDVLAKCEMFKGEARCIIGGEAPRLTGRTLLAAPLSRRQFSTAPILTVRPTFTNRRPLGR